MAVTKRVAILTGGGDVPGLNMCLKTLVYRLVDLGYEPIGVRKGWEGLINYNPEDPTTYSDNFIDLTKNQVRPIDRSPGSFLHSSRLDPRRIPPRQVPKFLSEDKKATPDMTQQILKVFERLGYQGIIVIGDDDTLNYAAHLSSQGLPVIAIPKTIHNNIPGTDYTLGFSTGLSRGVAFIHELRALAGSREQIVVVETFAAKSGYSTLLMALLAGVDRVLIPELPYDPDLLAFMAMQDRRQTPANYAVLLVCDGARPVAEKAEKYSHVIPTEGLLRQPAVAGIEAQAQKPRQSVLGRISEALKGAPAEGAEFQSVEKLLGSGMVAAQLLTHITQEEVFLQPLTYLLRTGSPDGQDLLGAANFAFIAANLMYQGQFGRMTAFVQDKMWTNVELSLALGGVKTVDLDAWYDSEDYRPKLSLIWSVE